MTVGIAVLLSAGGPSRALGAAAPRTHYDVRAALSAAAPQLSGTVGIDFTNPTAKPLDEVYLFLFPNRFARPDAGVNDFNRPFVYPEQDFDPGSMAIEEARDGDTLALLQRVAHPGLPDGTLMRMPIAPLPPGATRRLTLRFRTIVPYRFGTFGHFEGQITAVGGWYPYLAAVDADGNWLLDEPPPLADFAVHLTNGSGLEGVLNGRQFAREQTVAAELPAVHYLSLVAAPQLLRSETAVDGTRVVFFHRPKHRASRISNEPPRTELMLATLRGILEQRPPVVPPPPAELTVVEAPLRLDLTAPGEGEVVVSDRALEVNWLLRPFHELQIAQAVYAELMRPVLAAREPAGDYGWVSEGLSRIAADRFFARTRAGTRSVHDWIELFNIFAIVDRFESVPKIPFVDAFFERSRIADPLHARIDTFNNSWPPGRVILGKLRAEIGADELARVVNRCLAATIPFRACAGRTTGRDLDWLFAEWRQPYPDIDYRFESVDLNQPIAPGNRWRQTLTIQRVSSRPIREPVTVRLRSIGGRDVDLRWNGRGDVGHLSTETKSRVGQAVIDPTRRLIEDTRADNASPPSRQVVLDTAEVEISSTEFGISGLVVGRDRYDYRRDLAAAGFYTNRSIGVTAGARWHWGAPVDATTYRQNLYAFYGFQSLNGSFTDARRPTVRTPGQNASLGVRYAYSNVFAYDNPTDERHVGLFADWYDRGLGGDYDYADWGYSLVGTHPLGSYRTIGALQVFNGFSHPFGSSVVPNQGQYSLGGSRSIRGIGAEDELGRNIFVVRAEVRRDIYPELDLNLFDTLILRRGQLRLFADSGRVSNSAGRVYDPSGYAVGLGTGIAAVYDFLGFFPAVAYLEIATRVDDAHKAGDVQVLFGTRQAF